MNPEAFKKVQIMSTFFDRFGYKSTDALRKQRSKGNRPLFPYIKIGNRIFYDLSEILKLAERSLVKID